MISMKQILITALTLTLLGFIDLALAQSLEDTFQAGYDWISPTITIVATFAIFFMAGAILTRGFSIGYAIALLLAIGIAVNAPDIAASLTS